ncbi:hypothetical protein TIFTF001_015124 [Ficus carica]|uniref:Uncharacterized protein n=1 Tax=Ficus carica TaxID=3494 RepID=A0AA88D695_FICCA|nr:hypothetical protein TIFTF001_015124 [Ficus carica]
MKVYLQTGSSISRSVLRKLALKDCRYDGIEVWQQTVMPSQILFPENLSVLFLLQTSSELIAACAPQPTAVNLFSRAENAKGLASKRKRCSNDECDEASSRRQRRNATAMASGTATVMATGREQSRNEDRAEERRKIEKEGSGREGRKRGEVRLDN